MLVGGFMSLDYRLSKKALFVGALTLLWTAVSVLALGVLAPGTLAGEFFVTSVIREIPMKSDDVVFKDFYINAGSNNGLRKGIYLDAIRKLTTYDNLNSKMLGETSVRIARLRLIHVDKNFSIARLVNMYDKTRTPISGYDSVMVGDLVEVSEKQ